MADHLPDATKMPLSPATAAIVKAFDDRYELLGGFDDNWQEECLAAALLAAADQVVPEQLEGPPGSGFRWGAWAAKSGVRSELLAIAAELEGQ